MVWRALLIGLICLLVLTPPTLFFLGVLGVGELSRWHFVYFKAASPWLATKATTARSLFRSCATQPT
jgi:hypothetical protein